MSTTISEQRRIAIIGDGLRLDVSASLSHTLAQALSVTGITIEPGRDVLLDRSGREIAPATPVGDLEDGMLVTVVDLTKRLLSASDAPARHHSARADHRSTWWLLATVSMLLAVGALAALLAGSALLDDATLLNGALHAWAPLALAAGALAAASLWIARSPAHGAGAAALVSTLSLAFAAGTLAIPDATAASHLAVTVGLLTAATLGAAMAVAAQDRTLRAIAATLSVLLLVYGGIWGAVLLLEWGVVAAGALTLGLVLPGVRFLPTSLLPVADGYLINYKHFMSSRWTVRGSIPHEPGAVLMEAIRPTVEIAAARLRTGTIALCVTAPLMAPLVLPGMYDEGLFVRIGSIGLVIATITALFLMPRHGSDPATAWVSRAAAAVVVIEAALVVGPRATDVVVTVLATGLLAIGVLAAILIVPVSKGTRSLAWSRVGDALESMSVAFALPFALLAANMIELVRGMMSG